MRPRRLPGQLPVGGPDSFSFTWDVQGGPAKNLLLESHLVRIDAGRQS